MYSRRLTRIAGQPAIRVFAALTAFSVSSGAGLMAQSAPVRALVFAEGSNHGWPVQAAIAAGCQVTQATAANFNQLLDAGNFDVVLVDAPGNAPQAGAYADWNRLAEVILCRSARAVISIQYLCSKCDTGTLLMYACQVRDTVPGASSYTVYSWDANHPIANVPDPIAFPVDVPAAAWPNLSRKLEPDIGAAAIAGFAALPTPYETAILAAQSGRVVVNGFLVDDISDAALAVKLWKNELAFVLSAPAGSSTCPPRVPLTEWRNADGDPVVALPIIAAPSLADLNGDGWIDIFSSFTLGLWFNDGGSQFRLKTLDHIVQGPYTYRYGSSIGDYDGDGRPDVALEPRNDSPGIPKDSCFRLLRNIGSEEFIDITGVAMGQPPCRLDCETNCWADVDGDGRLDLFVPVYPPWFGSSGNLFFYNLGPDARGEYRFSEQSGPAGLENPPDTTKPEGVQFCDYDQDGDLDLYSNNVIYQNRSRPGLPLFSAMARDASGIQIRDVVDEGAAFVDYDMDGDFDLVVAYSGDPGVIIYENGGDGCLTPVTDRIESPLSGIDLGLSFQDWDHDGDIDLVTRDIFRRNMLMETGAPFFAIQPTLIPSQLAAQSIVAWADFDHDGDRDAIVASSGFPASLFLNTTYNAATPAAAKRTVCIRPVRDSATVMEGLDTEFGASVRVHVLDPADDLERAQFVASSSGYTNQNEYALSFSLPPDPYPSDARRDVRFSIDVTFPTDNLGHVHRVDARVNHVLSNIDLAALTQTEIKVFRSGKVILNSIVYLPDTGEATDLRTAAGGLVLPDGVHALRALTPAPAGNYFVGTEIVCPVGGLPVRIREFIVDGVLKSLGQCAGTSPFNVVAWDVTDPHAPHPLANGMLGVTPRPRNRRSFVPCDWLVLPGRTVRIVAFVASYRNTPTPGAIDEGPLRINGGIGKAASSFCAGLEIAAAPVNERSIFCSVRYATVNHDCNANGVPDEVEIAGGTQVDTNGNGIPDACELLVDCNSNGIPDAFEVDSDHDGVPDDCDGCPADVHKSAPGACGCGIPDADSDADGVPDCRDNCPLTPNAGQADLDHNGIGDACQAPIVITCPADPSAVAETAAGTSVSYASPMTSNAIGPVDIRSDHPSGSVFPVGTTQVSVTAMDAANRISVCSFRVHVSLTPAGPLPPVDSPAADPAIPVCANPMTNFLAPFCGTHCLAMVPLMLLGLACANRFVRRTRRQ